MQYCQGFQMIFLNNFKGVKKTGASLILDNKKGIFIQIGFL
jgi:hypothetical protein